MDVRSPSFKAGFAAPDRGSMAYPSLWRGCVGAWCPSLGQSGLVLRDWSASRNHGTLTTMDPGTDWVASQGKVALDFDGSNDAVDLGTKEIIPSGSTEFSIACWAYVRAFTNYASPISQVNASTPYGGWMVNTSTEAKFILTFNNGGTWRSDAVGNTVCQVNRWYHICATRIPGYGRVYINGRQDSTDSAYYGTMQYHTTLTAYVGRNGGGAYLNGIVDDLRVYNRALTQSEISTLALRRGIAYEPRSTTVYSVPAGGGTTVTPSTLALVLTAYAPTVTTPQTLTPTTLALTLSTFAPTVSTPILATPTTAALVLTAFEPTITATAHIVATPTTATLTLTAFEPTVTAGGSATVTPTTATLTLTTFAPTVTAGGDQTVTPTTATLTLSTFAPTVSTPQTVTPTTLALTLTTFAPTVSTPQTVTPTTLSLTLTTFAPTVTGVAPITVTPTTATLVLTAYAPTVSTVTADQIWTINLSLTGRRTASCLAVTAARSTAFACQYNDAVPPIAAGYGFLVEADGDYLVNSDGDYLIASV